MSDKGLALWLIVVGGAVAVMGFTGTLPSVLMALLYPGDLVTASASSTGRTFGGPTLPKGAGGGIGTKPTPGQNPGNIVNRGA
jgi:hypothetical protein